MYRALLDAISEFASANMRSLRLPASRTPAATPLTGIEVVCLDVAVVLNACWLVFCVDAPWLRAGIRTFRWPDETDAAPPRDEDVLRNQPWHGPTVVFTSLRKHVQCAGVFLAEFNKPVHCHSWPIPRPLSFLSVLTRTLQAAVQECAAGLCMLCKPCHWKFAAQSCVSCVCSRSIESCAVTTSRA
jgi:hypothetical protein